MGEEVALRRALESVRPSAPNFWLQVATLVGRPVVECQHKVEEPLSRRVRPPAAKRKWGGDLTSPAGAAGASVGALEALPKRDGPKRLRMIHKFVHERSFGPCFDFLAMPQDGADPWLLDERPLHELPLGRASVCGVGATGLGQVLGGELGAPAGAGAALALGLGDATWRPMGLDAFISRAQASRLGRCSAACGGGAGGRAAVGGGGAAAPDAGLPLPGSPGKTPPGGGGSGGGGCAAAGRPTKRRRRSVQGELRRAEVLFRKLDGSGARGYEVFHDAADDEDAAPVAVVPHM